MPSWIDETDQYLIKLMNDYIQLAGTGKDSLDTFWGMIDGVGEGDMMSGLTTSLEETNDALRTTQETAENTAKALGNLEAESAKIAAKSAVDRAKDTFFKDQIQTLLDGSFDADGEFNIEKI